MPPRTIGLGVLAFLPVIGFFLYFVSFALIPFTFAFSSQPNQGPPPFLFLPFLVFPLVMLFQYGAAIVYCILVAGNARLDTEKKILWAAVIFLGGMVAIPIYWWRYVLKTPAPETAATPDAG